MENLILLKDNVYITKQTYKKKIFVDIFILAND